ncbi:MAG TPA: TlpA disulfide reductase family protein [Flavisolibacter sp.]|jgi:peroxiredoxin|nr:TlpA disulfide reductase family protein [Flavisolibacter sp.]
MKKIFYLAFIGGILSCNNKTAGKIFEVEGTVKNSGAKMIYLEENIPNGRPTIMDSALINTGGSFSLKAPVKEESLYQLRLEKTLVPFALFINDVPKVKLQADVNNVAQPYVVEGSPASKALISFDKTIYEQGLKLFTAGSKVDSLMKAKAADSLTNSEYAKVETAATELKNFVTDFLQKSSSPILTLYAVSSFQNTATNLGIQGFSTQERAAIISAAAAKFPAHTALQTVKNGLASAKAPEFTQPGVNGQPVSLSSFKGKYVLLDFWASWCRPCRQDNPNVVKAYNEFKNKNFTVFGVSLDQNKEAWLQAIQQDSLTWTHASDLKFWSNAAAALYGVQGIPANFLIDPQGNIIAENLHGEDIVRTLRKVVK